MRVDEVHFLFGCQIPTMDGLGSTRRLGARLVRAD
jgi:hypothetical protein